VACSKFDYLSRFAWNNRRRAIRADLLSEPVILCVGIFKRALHAFFRCRHPQVTRPITPRSQVLGHNRQTYVVCLDCGTELGYDLAAMRMGSPLSSSAPMPMPQTAETGGPGALTTSPRKLIVRSSVLQKTKKKRSQLSSLRRGVGNRLEASITE
jgi:hypothetical protein